MEVKETKREIVNWNNDLVNFPLKGLSANELDILMGICYRCQRNGTDVARITFDELKKLSYFSSKDNEQFYERLLEINNKLGRLLFVIDNKKIHAEFVLFSGYVIDKDNEHLDVAVSQIFTYLLNDFEKNYTSMELFEHASLKSIYSKAVYKRLRQFRNQEKPFWKVSYGEFREYLDIPNTYRSCHIDANILSVVIDDNQKFFPNLKVEKYYEKPKGRGRTKLGGYIFTYDKPKNVNKYKPLEIDKEKDIEEDQHLDQTPESKKEMEMFPENVPFFD